jgi:hypothetical protein
MWRLGIAVFAVGALALGDGFTFTIGNPVASQDFQAKAAAFVFRTEVTNWRYCRRVGERSTTVHCSQGGGDLQGGCVRSVPELACGGRVGSKPERDVRELERGRYCSHRAERFCQRICEVFSACGY